MRPRAELDKLRESIARVGQQQRQRDRQRDPNRFDHDGYRRQWEAALADRGREQLQADVETAIETIYGPNVLPVAMEAKQ